MRVIRLKRAADVEPDEDDSQAPETDSKDTPRFESERRFATCMDAVAARKHEHSFTALVRWTFSANALDFGREGMK